ncbi:ROK family glucokinase [Lentilactobacillus otakiensis]|mgnify:FL=1|uniref:Glucokinase n=1 Tax=Lentilactobacillus otakiensis DSM 19908 = JCM 15040 TaxID=1423780 RepID=S4PN66_9LACO|nr:ROK family glucokinase [Lentilactobacillus otakiensis]KRL09275.1 ROK family glucokinase [Lentilactobacillus otakiensis DSM 19908 = JCM 15040]MBZ3776670.1 ROK family glucokinase [Lentilactobacillus otakiensis]MDV3519110.1 ROK family glucokinase [Lentilactobacillus otakiensis]GAD15720.1 ROK family glucokinase [Lentilactobacillus otakiensis DSM 19908 = JCM 15040]
MAKKLIGIDLGGTTTKFAFIDTKGNVLTKWRIPTNITEHGSHIVPDMIKSISDQMRKDDYNAADFYGIGMGTPGAVNREKGTVVGAYNLNWDIVQPVGATISANLNLPILIDNDANSAALGEYWKGAGDKAKDVVFITLGTGVGGGVIANGKLVHGINNGAGEVGHITVVPNGYQCTCGKRGCLEQYASATGVVHIAKDMAEKFTGHSRIKELIDGDEDLSSKMVFFLADNGDILANQIVDRVCSYLGLALSHIGNTLNPENIIIGGGVSNAGNTLLQPTTRYFQENAFPSVRDSTRLKLAQLGNDAGVIGAASLALQFRNNQPFA